MMNDLISRQAVQEMIDRIGEMYPYRQIGNRDSYSPYNEAWTDAINRVDAELNSLPSAQKTQLSAEKTQLSTEDTTLDTTFDCISRQAAIYAADMADYPGLSIEDVDKVTGEVVKALKELPSAQPEIIRCKDCKWKQGSECVRFADVRPFPDDFCSRAERRTDE